MPAARGAGRTDAGRGLTSTSASIRSITAGSSRFGFTLPEHAIHRRDHGRIPQHRRYRRRHAGPLVIATTESARWERWNASGSALCSPSFDSLFSAIQGVLDERSDAIGGGLDIAVADMCVAQDHPGVRMPEHLRHRRQRGAACDGPARHDRPQERAQRHHPGQPIVRDHDRADVRERADTGGGRYRDVQRRRRGGGGWPVLAPHRRLGVGSGGRFRFEPLGMGGTGNRTLPEWLPLPAGGGFSAWGAARLWCPSVSCRTRPSRTSFDLAEPQRGSLAVISEFDPDVVEAWCGAVLDGHIDEECIAPGFWPPTPSREQVGQRRPVEAVLAHGHTREGFGGCLRGSFWRLSAAAMLAPGSK